MRSREEFVSWHLLMPVAFQETQCLRKSPPAKFQLPINGISRCRPTCEVPAQFPKRRHVAIKRLHFNAILSSRDSGVIHRAASHVETRPKRNSCLVCAAPSNRRYSCLDIRTVGGPIASPHDGEFTIRLTGTENKSAADKGPQLICFRQTAVD